MRQLRISLIIITLIISFPTMALAEGGSTTSRSSGGAAMALIMYLICSRRKEKEIGGWLLYYYIQLYLGLIMMIVITIASINNYNPASWEDNKLYMLFLFSTIPGILVYFIQTGVAAMAMKTRDYEWIKKLRAVLIIDIIIVLLATLIDFQFFKDNLAIDILQLIWPLIWLPYFYKSVRVEKVFVSKDWLTVPLVSTNK